MKKVMGLVGLLMSICASAISVRAETPADALRRYSGLTLKPFEVSFTGATFVKELKSVDGEVLVEPGDILAMVTVGCKRKGLAYFDGKFESVLNKTPGEIRQIMSEYNEEDCEQYKRRNIYPIEILKARTLTHVWLDISFDDAKGLTADNFRSKTFSSIGAIVVAMNADGKGAKSGFHIGDQIFRLEREYEPSWLTSLLNGGHMASKNIDLNSVFYDARARRNNNLDLNRDRGITFLEFETIHDGKYEWKMLTNSILVVGD